MAGALGGRAVCSAPRGTRALCPWRLWRAVHLCPHQLAASLSADGGGMKGMATVRLLKELERHTGRRIHELFDLIGEISLLTPAKLPLPADEHS